MCVRVSAAIQIIVAFDTWNEFRGYNRVVADTVGSGQTETRFHQGLHGERLTSTTTRSVNVTRSDGATIADTYALRGQVYETRQLTDGGAEISRSWTEFTNTATTTGNTDRTDPRFVAPDKVTSRTDGITTTETEITYNAWGQTSAVKESGDTSLIGDNRTTVTSFYPANTSGTLGNWRSPMPCVTAIRSGTNTAAPTFNTAGFVRWTHTSYDGDTAASCSGSVDEPVPTRTSVAHSTSGRLITSYLTDSRGRVNQVTDPEGEIYTTVFDNVHGQVVRTVNPLGWEDEILYDDWRRPVTQIDINDRETRTTYDEYSRVTTVRDQLAIDENRDTVRYFYNQDANPSYVRTQTIIDGSDYTDTAVFYDGFGRQILTRTLAPTVGDNWVTAVRYDTAGRQDLASAQYQLGSDNVTTFDYPVWTTVPSVNETVYDDANRATAVRTRGVGSGGTIRFETELDYFGARTRTTDPNGAWTDTTVDGLGRVINVTEQQGTPDLETQSTYNVAGDLTQTIAPDGEVTTITYDLAGRKESVDDPDSEGLWEYTYDANSNLLTETDPSDDVTRFTYDALNRLVREYVNERYRGLNVYDQTGQRGTLYFNRNTEPNGDRTYEQWLRDSYGRVNQLRTLIPDADSSGLMRFRTTYGLRDDGQVRLTNHTTGSNYELGYRTPYTYNTRTGAQIGLAEEAASGGETIVNGVEWNQAGQVVEHSYGTATASPAARWVYNSATLRLSQDAFGTNGWLTRDRANNYTYDDNGNITSIREIRNSNQYQCFSYDQIDRLLTAYTDNTSACNGHTAVGQGNYNDTYTYSRGGDLTSHTGTGEGSQRGTYTYADPNLAHAVTGIGDGSAFAYDDNGNMVIRNLAGQTAQTLTWDEGRRLAEVNQGGATVAEFLYALDDSRVRRVTDDGTATYYLLDGTEYTEGPNGNFFTYYHQINGDAVAFTRSDTGVTTWMGSDIVNSTAVTADENGTISTQRYTPFGEQRNAGNLDTDHLYTGQVHDESSGLAFYNARYYDPAIGRFITPDSIVPNPQDGQDYNRYTYVGNNPIRWDDPTGHCFDICPPSDADVTEEVLARHAAEVQVESNPTFGYNGTGGAAPLGSTANCQTARCVAERASLAPIPYISDAIDVGLCADSAANGSRTAAAVDCGSVFLPLIGAGLVRKLFGRWLPAPSGTLDDLVVACLRSFSADTEVLMADGSTTPISEVQVGDEVWSVEPETAEAGNRTVTAVWPHQDTLLEFTVEGGSVTTTEDHHFWNHTDGEWQETQHIDEGDYLLTADGHVVEAGNLDWTTAHFADAYDLTVESLHTYFVVTGGEEVLVHNCDLDTARANGARIFTTGDAHLPDEIVRSLSTHHGVSERLASARLHQLKDGIEGNPNVALSLNGEVWDLRSGEHLGSLTQGGGDLLGR